MIHLEENQLEIVRGILSQQLPNIKVVAFGSRVRGDFKPPSDLDICIINDAALSFSELAQLREAFSNSDLPIRVDIVEWNKITNDFQKLIEACHEKIQ